MRWRVPVALGLAGLAFPAGAAAEYDFDGDGRQELVLGAPGVNIGAYVSGAVVVLKSSGRGLSLSSPQVVSQASDGVPGEPEDLDQLGWAVGGGDFNGDGFDDLAVGSNERIADGSVSFGEGTVTVLYGGPAGLNGTGAAEFGGMLFARREDSYRYSEGSSLGSTLAAADFDADGFSDLAVTAGREAWQGDSGVVHLLFGGPAGLSRERERTLGAPGSIRVEFGRLLATGDIDRDGHVDLIEGAPGDHSLIDGGGVYGHLSFCRGAPGGPVGCRLITPRSRTYAEGSGDGRREAPNSLAVGDVTGDGYPDIVEGVPENRWWNQGRGAPPAGAVIIRRGTPRGPGRRPLRITQDSPGVPGSSEPFDEFGHAVAVGNLDGDRYADLVVAARGELSDPPQRGAARISGRITVIRGGPRSGIARTGSAVLDRGARVTPSNCLDFPSAMTLLDLDGDHRLDVTVGGPCSDRNTDGKLVTFFGVRGGLDTTRAVPFGAPQLGLASGDVGLVLGR